MENNQVFEKFNGKLKDLFPSNKNYTFLVGAGISMEAPTNMPSAMQIVKVLLDFCAPSEEVNTLLQLDLLRYELVVEKIQQIFDEELRFMDYIELVTSPNLIHLFLANLIKKNQYVITTNFDYLIEQALIRLLPDAQHFNIYPIITKQDFISFQDPNKLLETRKYPVFKIHGSKRNIVTGELTQESLITTISALGKEREEGETFAIEPYKKPAIYNLMKDRTLVIMGYSGSDDFDIGPMLKELPFLSKLIWIEHSFDDEIKITKINKSTGTNKDESVSRSKRLLSEIRNRGNFEVFLINAHTSNLIRNKLWDVLLPDRTDNYQDLSQTEADVPAFHEWINPLYKDLSILDKYRFACQLYYFLKETDGTVRCSQKGINLSEEKGDLLKKSIFLNFSGMINILQGKYDEALKIYNEALILEEQFKDPAYRNSYISNIGSIYLILGKYDDAIKKFEESLEICEQIGDVEGKANDLNNIGRIHEIRGEYDSALNIYEESLQITENLGNLNMKATLLNNIGRIYYETQKYDEAMKNYEEALHITEQLGDLSGKIILLNNIGRVYDDNKNYDVAMEHFEETIRIAEQIGDLSRKAGCLNNVGSLYLARGNPELALEKYKEALDIEERLGDPLMKVIYLNNIGMIYTSQGKLSDALKNYESALAITEEIGDTSKTALLLSKIGGIFINEGDFKTGLEKYEKSEKLYEQVGDFSNRAACLSNIGKINEKLGHYEVALNIYKQTLEIDEQLGDEMSKANDFNNIGKIYEIQGEFNKAIKYYEKTLEIFKKFNQQQYVEIVQGNIDNLREKLKN